MRLPPPLAPWSAPLALLPADVAVSLGPMIRRLAAAIGDWPQHPEGLDGEPDGFDGLSRRGSYERLLATEWLLADELPDEFLRRAGVGEHTFLRLARPERQAQRHCLVLFDAGPAQIGTPRIAHVALLIVLSRRAAAARAAFSWGVLQRPAEGTVAELTPEGLRRLLAARSPLEPTPVDVDRWRVRAEAETIDDVWLVGGRRWDALASSLRWSSVLVDDVLEPDARALRALIRPARRSTIELLLELPPDAVCTRLLRNPSGETTPATASSESAPSANLCFSSNGNRILSRTTAGQLLDYLVSPTAKARLMPPTLFGKTSRSPIIAAEHAGRRLFRILRSETSVEVEVFSKRGYRENVHTYVGDLPSVPYSAVLPFGPCFPLLGGFFVRDASGPLLRLIDAPRRGHVAAVSGPRALAATLCAQGCLSFVHQPGPMQPWQAVVIASSSMRDEWELSSSDLLEAHIGYELASTRRPAVAFCEGGATHTMLWNGQRYRVATRGGRVLGVFRNRETPGLVVFGSDVAPLAMLGPGGTWTLAGCPDDATPAAFSPFSGRIAFLTDHEELIVYSIPRAEVLCRWLPPAGSSTA
jgi:hypothetical protein